MKKALSAFVLGIALSAGCAVQAGSIPSYMVPLKAYAVRYMECYPTPGGEPKGYIDAGDYVIVEKIENGWAYVSYPVGNKRISRWFKADDLVNNVAFINQDRTSPQQTTNTYKMAGYDSVFGSFNNYEPIVVVSDSGEFRQVIYKLSSGGYKMAWVPYWDCWLNGRSGRNEKEERKVNNNTVNKDPIIQPVKREEKKTEQTTTSTTEKGSIKYTSDTFGNASLSGRRLGYVTAGSDIEILAYAGDAYYIRYWTDSGQARERYVNKGAVKKAEKKEEPVNNGLESKFAELESMYPTGSIWDKNGIGFDGAWNCHGFALLVGNKICGYSARNWSRAYDIDTIKPGDIIRYQQNSRRYDPNNRKNKKWADYGHTIVITKVSGNNVTYVDCNGVDPNKEPKNTVKWDRKTTKSYLKQLFLKGDYILVYPG